MRAELSADALDTKANICPANDSAWVGWYCVCVRLSTGDVDAASGGSDDSACGVVVSGFAPGDCAYNA